MRTNRKKRTDAGFTMLEIIITLLIVSILTTILVPSLTGYIDQANDRLAVTECRQCVTVAQALASERYAYGGTLLTIGDKAEIVALAQVPAGGSITELSAKNDSVSRLVYHSTVGRTVTYADGVYTISDGAVSFSNTETVSTIKQFFSDPVYNQNRGIVDSGATVTDGSKAVKIKNALIAKGIDLDALDAATWQYNPKGEGFFYWTTVDISELPIGTLVPVMRYNYNTRTYTVWYASIGTDSVSKGSAVYNTLGDPEAKRCLSSTGTGIKSADQTYEKMITDYNNALADYQKNAAA